MANRLLGGIALCAFLLAPVWAETPATTVLGTPPQPTWGQLTLEQRAILAPLGNEWDKMEYFRRKKWLGIADRFSRMTPEEQRRVQDRMREWTAMSPEQRAKARDSYKEFQNLPPEKKQSVKEKWETYSRLPQEEKARIRQNKATAKPVPAEATLPPAAVSTTSQDGSPATFPTTSTPPAAPAPSAPNLPAPEVPKP